MKHQIGRVIEVSGDQVIVEIEDYLEDQHIGVPDNMILTIKSKSGPVKVHIGQPGTFVELKTPEGQILCLIVETRMKEISLSVSAEKVAEARKEYLTNLAVRVLVTIPIGTMSETNVFERGTSVLPTVNSPAYAVSPETIDEIFKNYAEGDFSLGKLSMLPEHDAKINLDAYLGRHSAILGQTGGGKSWTVASMLQKISDFKQSTVVLFDLHGEYASAFDHDVEIISAADIEMPYWLMNSEELLDLMIDRAESNAPNQNAKFKELLQSAKETHPENITLGIDKITIDTPVYFDFDSIIREFKDLDTKRVIGSSGKEKNGPLFGQFTRLLMRLESRLNDRRYDIIFKPKTYNTSASMEDLFRKLLGEVIGNRKKIVIIDLSPVPFDVRSSVISLILRCLFDFAYWYRRVNQSQYPIAIFADEAHIYLSDESQNYSTRHSAERIAKEGRKYGVSLNVISQRPREVSSTILSQCGSFFCLRISNPDDQSYVKNLLPDSIRGISSMFSTLRRGEAILIGDSVLMPTRITVEPPNPQPISNDASFVKHWMSEPKDLDMDAILNAWRNQKVV